MKNLLQSVVWKKVKFNETALVVVSFCLCLLRVVNMLKCEGNCASHEWRFWEIRRCHFVQGLCNGELSKIVGVDSLCNYFEIKFYYWIIMNCSQQCFVSTSQFFVHYDKFQVAMDERNQIPRLLCQANSSDHCPKQREVHHWKKISELTFDRTPLRLCSPIAQARINSFIFISRTNHLVIQLNVNVFLLMPLYTFAFRCKKNRIPSDIIN